MKNLSKPKFSLGRISNKYIILDIFSHSNPIHTAYPLLWRLSKSNRQLITENFEAGNSIFDCQENDYLRFNTFSEYWVFCDLMGVTRELRAIHFAVRIVSKQSVDILRMFVKAVRDRGDWARDWIEVDIRQSLVEIAELKDILIPMRSHLRIVMYPSQLFCLCATFSEQLLAGCTLTFDTSEKKALTLRAVAKEAIKVQNLEVHISILETQKLVDFCCVVQPTRSLRVKLREIYDCK